MRMRTQERKRFSSIKLRKVIRTSIASRRLERIPEALVNVVPMTESGSAHNSFGSADSVKNYDYCRTRNRGEIYISEAAGRSGGFVLRQRVRQRRTGDSITRRKSPTLLRTGRSETQLGCPYNHTRSLANLEFRCFLWKNYQKDKQKRKKKNQTQLRYLRSSSRNLVRLLVDLNIGGMFIPIVLEHDSESIGNSMNERKARNTLCTL